jgi:hypothetical protein
MPEARLFFMYSALSAAVGWPIIGIVLAVVVVVAAAAAFGFALPLAKAGEIEMARIARPTMVIFFMLSSLEKDTGQSITNLG